MMARCGQYLTHALLASEHMFNSPPVVKFAAVCHPPFTQLIFMITLYSVYLRALVGVASCRTVLQTCHALVGQGSPGTNQQSDGLSSSAPPYRQNMTIHAEQACDQHCAAYGTVIGSTIPKKLHIISYCVTWRTCRTPLFQWLTHCSINDLLNNPAQNTCSITILLTPFHLAIVAFAPSLTKILNETL